MSVEDVWPQEGIMYAFQNVQHTVVYRPLCELKDFLSEKYNGSGIIFHINVLPCIFIRGGRPEAAVSIEMGDWATNHVFYYAVMPISEPTLFYVHPSMWGSAEPRNPNTLHQHHFDPASWRALKHDAFQRYILETRKALS